LTAASPRAFLNTFKNHLTAAKRGAGIRGAGKGTPLPFDLPPSGHQRNIRLPSQSDATVGSRFADWLRGAAVANIWLARVGVMAHLYSSGLAGWDEDGDLPARFGDRWIAYRNAVTSWVPRLRPLVRSGYAAGALVHLRKL
jgi:hypothetical protein